MTNINVRIKLTPGDPPRPATTKIMMPELTREQKEQGLVQRPLEPYEVVPLPEDTAKEMLDHLPYELEMTHEKPTRPLFFNNQREADLSSQDYKEVTGGRADEVKKKVAGERARQAEKMRREMAEQVANEPNPQVSDEMLAAVVASLEAKGYTISKPGSVIPDAVLPEPTVEVEVEDDYVPENNATAQSDLEAVVEDLQKEAGDADEVVSNVNMARDTTEDENQPPPPKRRRRSANKTK